MSAARMLLCVLVLILASLRGAAHPGVGIVMDRQGNIFYTDLTHVWKQTPAGKRSIAVRNVHTHELYLDAAGNLFGEHAWYEGEVINKWGYYVWCLKPNGQLSKVIPKTEGFRHDYSFVRDARGSMYWMEDVGTRQLIRRKATSGPVRTLATGRFGPAHWMTCTAAGTVYFLKGDTLCRISPAGQVTRAAYGLSRQHPVENHSIMGLWTDPAGYVYVANTHDNVVQRIAPNGAVRIVAKGSPVWTASGGLIAPNGDLWLLEYTSTNSVRVRRVPQPPAR